MLRFGRAPTPVSIAPDAGEWTEWQNGEQKLTALLLRALGFTLCLI